MVYKENIGEILCHIQLCSMPDMGVVDNASDENNENTRRKATVVPIKIEYVCVDKPFNNVDVQK